METHLTESNNSFLPFPRNGVQVADFQVSSALRRGFTEI